MSAKTSSEAEGRCPRPRQAEGAAAPRNGPNVDELLAHLRSFDGVPYVPFAQYEESLKRILELEFKPAKSGFVEASALSERQRELLSTRPSPSSDPTSSGGPGSPPRGRSGERSAGRA